MVGTVQVQVVQIARYIDVSTGVEVAAVDQREDVAVSDDQFASTDVIMCGSTHLC